MESVKRKAEGMPKHCHSECSEESFLLEGLMYIGNVKTDNNIFLAPMAGITDIAFRLICKEFGCGLVYTEMVSAKGIYYKSENTVALAEIDEKERPVTVQIFGSDAEIMAYAAIQLEKGGADIIDINMGCPTPKIVNNGDGCALMKNPKLAGKIIDAVVKAVKIPVTVKIRKGWDEKSINAQEIAYIAQENGAKALALHGRTREQFYSGKADWNIIRKVKEDLSIPVIGNGDVYSPQDAKNMMEETGCDALLIGRGAQGNPWIFQRTLEYLKNKTILPEPPMEERVNMIIEHMDRLIKLKGEYVGIKEMRKHIVWYLKGLPNSSKLKNQVFNMNHRGKIEELLIEYLKSNNVTIL